MTDFDFSKLLGNARQMQEQLEKSQKAVAEMRVTGAAGGDMVTITASGERRVLDVHISPEALADRDMLQDLLAAAFNDALRKVEEATKEKMHASLGGLARFL